jgi:predicted secreted protein
MQLPIRSPAMIRLAAVLASLWLLTCRNAPPASPVGSAGAAGGGASGQSASDTVVHAEDDGKTLEVATGGTVTFKLATSAGTGYVWMPTGVDPAVLEQLGDRTSEVGGNVAGAPNMDIYRFAAQRAGSTPVQMDLQRPWTKSAPPAKSIHVIVNVH